VEPTTDGAGNPGSPPRQTVLIIDDDRGYAGVIGEFLELAGLAALATSSGEEGLAAARQSRPDLILLDVQMPGIDGYETCRRLKADGATAEIPVLFMSGQAEIEDKLQGFTAGGLDYIPKPFKSQELLARVRTHLRLQDQARHLLEQTLELSRAHEQLEQEVARRVRAEGVLQRAHDQLEERVEARTAALRTSQSELTAKILELSALNAIAHIIANTDDLAEMLRRVLEATLSLTFLEVQRKGLIFLRDETDPAKLNRVAQVGIAPYLAENERQIAIGHCLCGTCAGTGRNIVTTTSCIAEHTVQYPGMPDHGHAVIPIRSHENVLGVMTMYLAPGVHPSGSDVRLLEAIASQIGLAVENRRLFRSVATGKKEWEETFDAIADLVTINALDQTVLRMNSAAARVFGGYDHGLGRKFFELLDDEGFAEGCRAAPDSGATPRTATIQGRQYDTSVYPIEEQGVPRGCVFVAKDVTERNLAERSLREQRAFTDDLIRSSSVATFVINARHEVVIWNKACEVLTGFPQEAMLGTAGQWRPFYAQRRPVLADIVLDGYSETLSGLYATLSKSVLTAEGLHAEGWYRNLNGRDRYIVFDAAPVRGGDGTVLAAIETLQDITGRKRAEEEIAESESRYHTLVENAHDMFQIFAPDGRLLYVNPAWLRIMGYASEDARTLTVFDLLAASCKPECLDQFRALLAGVPIEAVEAQFVARDGRVIDVEGSATVNIADGRPVSIQAILHDVTGRKRLAEMTEEQFHIAEFERDIGAILNAGESVTSVLKSCTDAMVKHFDAAFARIWTMDDTKTVLELQASSGLYTHTDGAHSKLPVGRQAKIPLIAATGKPNLTNQVVGDPGVTEQEWAVREGIVSFAGYPLIVEDRVLGVLGMFAKRPLSELVLRALEFVAGNIALGIERAHSAEALARYSGELTALNAASNTLMATGNLQQIYQKICDIVISVFDLKLCWLGLVEPGSRDVRPVAHAGQEDGYLSVVRVTWDDSPHGNGPTGTAIKTHTTCQETVDAPRFGPWSAEAKKRGYLASLAVPLLYAHDTCVGVLNFYSGQAGYFTVDRVKLCQIFANQAAIAVENARLIEGLEETVLERTRKIKDANRELRHLNRELELRRQEAEAANRTKSDFLANMSHELRTPLNAIIGFSDLMVRGMAGPLAGDQKEYLGDILGSGQHLLSLINDILDLSKVEAGKMEFEPAEFDLADLVGSSLSLFREKALKHGIRLAAQTAAGAIRVYGDERRIKQVVFNLVSNAMKFTPDGGSVSVRTKAVEINGEDHAEISVADTGIGMTLEEQRQLFQPFRQLGDHLTKRHEGTGLGLALCKKFVEAHSGSIAVESAPGHGSTFTVRLPLRAGRGGP
jgi:PAS domain S-box-containing protein